MNAYNELICIWQMKVADCDTREFTDQKREEMLVSDFIPRCLQIGDSAVQCSNENHASNGHSVPYLKDWHFVKVCRIEPILSFLSASNC